MTKYPDHGFEVLIGEAPPAPRCRVPGKRDLLDEKILRLGAHQAIVLDPAKHKRREITHRLRRLKRHHGAPDDLRTYTAVDGRIVIHRPRAVHPEVVGDE